MGLATSLLEEVSTVFEYPAGSVIAPGSNLVVENNAGAVHASIDGYIAAGE